MAFHEVLFPTDISYGSKGGPTYNTKVVTLVSGQEQRIPRWSFPQFKYDVAEAVKAVNAWNVLATFYIARLGPANGFRFKDWTHFSSASDHRSAPTNADQNIGTGDGTTLLFQLRKAYTSGSYTAYKNITKPVTASYLVAVNGVAKVLGTDYSVDDTTGTITFVAAPGAALAVTAGYYFDTPVRFGDELDQNFLFNYEAFDIGSISSVPLLEIINPAAVDEEFYYGDSAQLTYSANISITSLTGRVLTLVPASALTVFLPNPSIHPMGGPHWYIWNNGTGTATFNVGSTTQFTLAAGSKCTVCLAYSSGVKTWVAF